MHQQENFLTVQNDSWNFTVESWFLPSLKFQNCDIVWEIILLKCPHIVVRVAGELTQIQIKWDAFDQRQNLFKRRELR